MSKHRIEREIAAHRASLRKRASARKETLRAQRSRQRREYLDREEWREGLREQLRIAPGSSDRVRQPLADADPEEAERLKAEALAALSRAR
jgi:hypothetical protein